MELIIFPLLSRKSQKAMLRIKYSYGRRWGHQYKYEPTGPLLEKLAEKLQMPKDEVRAKIMIEREYLLSQRLSTPL